MALQDRPVCFYPPCAEFIEKDFVFEAPCGHDDHPSAVFHPLCLMGWREFKEDMEREIKRFVAEHEARRDNESE